MKLLCVNAKKITLYSEVVKKNAELTPTGLIEGNIYETKTKPHIDELGFECYYIDGLGERLKSRFAELLNDNDSEEKDKESLQDELELAIDNEDYLLADKLNKQLKELNN